jgi:hypothetical protein
VLAFVYATIEVKAYGEDGLDLKGRPSETVRLIDQPPERETPIAEMWLVNR